MTILPCKHEQSITDQVGPTIDLLTNMDKYHPNILKEHSIQPEDYNDGLVFRSAIESIRGSYIASSKPAREGLVGDILYDLLQQKKIVGYEHTGNSNRYDYSIKLEKDPDYFATIEVKGGEGNSINISDRPIWAREFGVWCHLDGAIVNQPAHGAHSIINRLTNELVRRKKQADVLFFKDILCGTKTRPCPKYPGQETTKGHLVAPDIFLFPQRVPTINDPEPPVHTLETLKLPKIILDIFNVPPEEYLNHVWGVKVRLIRSENGKLKREVKILHSGIIVDESVSRPWKP